MSHYLEHCPPQIPVDRTPGRRVPPSTWLRRTVRRVLVLALCLGLAMSSPAVPAAFVALAQPATLDDALTRLDLLRSVLASLSDDIDRSQFDVDALALELAFEDPETIATWVREHIAYEQYQGLLRGADGTLMGRAGNSLDQAVLLASVLNSAGYEARIQRGRLSLDAAATLLGRSATPIEAASWDTGAPSNLPGVLTLLRELGGLDDADMSEIDTYLTSEAQIGATPEFRSADEEARHLLDVLRASDLGPTALDEAAPAEGLVSEAQEYFWVEVRIGPDAGWSALHTAFTDVEVATLGLDELTSDRTLTDAVPADLQHRVRFEVQLEVKRGDQIEIVDVIAPWERPAANLHGRPVTFRNFPDGLLALTDTSSATGALAATDFYYPLLDGALAPGGLAFDVAGFTVDPIVANDPAAGVVRTVGGAFGQAAAGLTEAAGGDGDGLVVATAQWFVFTVISPDGVEVEHRRAVFDRVDPADRAAGRIVVGDENEGDLAARIAAEYTFTVAAGRISPVYHAAMMVEGYESVHPLLERGARASLDPEASDGRPEGPLTSEAPAYLGLLKLFEAGDRGAEQGMERSYRHGPAIAVYRQVTLEPGRIEATTDIVTSPRRSLAWGPDGGVVSTPAGTLFAGVFETVLEASYLEVPRDDVASAAALLAGARRDGRSMVVLDSTDLEDVASMPLGAEARTNLRRDLERGYLVVLAPDSATAGRTAWWRVDPVSGETLGVLSSGEGGAITEYTVLLALGTAGATFLGCYSFAGDGDPVLKGLGCGICAGFAFGAVLLTAALAPTFTVGSVGNMTVFSLWHPSQLERLVRLAYQLAAAVCAPLVTQIDWSTLPPPWRGAELELRAVRPPEVEPSSSVS